MIRIERADLVDVDSGRSGVAGRDGLLGLSHELFDERSGLHALARFLIQLAGLVIHQVVRQDVGGDVDGTLKVAGRHGLAGLIERGGGRVWRERIDVDGRLGVLRLLQELLRRVEHRIHSKDEPASLYDFFRSTLLVEGERLLEGRQHPLFDSGRQRGVAEVSAHSGRARDVVRRLYWHARDYKE